MLGNLSRKQRLLLAAGLTFGLLLFSTLVVLRLSLYGAHFSSFAANQLSRILGMPVAIESTQVDFPVIRLHNVILGGKRQGLIDDVTLRIGLLPFSGAFLAPETVSIGNVRLEIPKNTASGIVGRLLGRAPESEVGRGNEKAASLHFVPLHTNIDSLQLLLDQGQKVESFAIQKLQCHKSSDDLSCAVAQLKSPTGWREDDMSLVLSKANSGRWLLKGSGRSTLLESDNNSENTPAWNVDLSIETSMGTTTGRFQLRGLPAAVREILDKAIGSQPAAALKGMIRAKPLDGGNIAYGFALETEHLDFSSTAISRDPIGPFPALLRAKGRLFPSQGALTVEAGSIILSTKRMTEGTDEKALDEPEMSPSEKWQGRGTLKALFNARGDWGSKEEPRNGSQWTIQFKVPSTACNDIVNFAPEMMWPPLRNLVLLGTTELDAEIQISSIEPQNFVLNIPSARYDCKIGRLPTELAPTTLQNTLIVRRTLKSKEERFIEIGPNSPNYVSYEKIPNIARTAILTAEDAGFFVHHGIDFPQMELALRRNLTEGRIHVGASTITMQTVKNLFLSNERTLVRKLQELLLAWTLEKEISKARILEIYLNLAEFGPGIYGIGEASQHFFDKRAADLSLVESLYLATLLPSPTDRYLSFCRGELSPGHRDLLETFLKRMEELGRISPMEYQQNFATPVRFSSKYRDSLDTCRARMGSVVLTPKPTR